VQESREKITAEKESTPKGGKTAVIGDLPRFFRLLDEALNVICDFNTVPNFARSIWRI